MRVVLSEHNLNIDEGSEQILEVEKLFFRQFNSRTFNNDIMLVKVNRRFGPWSPLCAPLLRPCGVVRCPDFLLYVPAETARTAEQLRPARWAPRWNNPPQCVHGERLGCDTEVQACALPRAACCGCKSVPLLPVLLLGQDHRKHDVCWTLQGWQRFLPGKGRFICFMLFSNACVQNDAALYIIH